MISISLPDGSVRRFERPVTVAEVAAAIGPGLAKAALAGKVDGKLVDTSHRIEQDARVAIVVDRDPEGLEIIRHSTAHLLAYAVKDLFPDAQITIGPVIENGFYYDISYRRPFTPEDLETLERKTINDEWIKMFPDAATRPARQVMVTPMEPGVLIQCDFLAVTGN